MKKYLPCALVLFLLFVSGCNSSTRSDAAAEPSMPAAEQPAPTPDSNVSAASDSVMEICPASAPLSCEEEAMYAFLQNALHREPASITLTEFPEEEGDLLLTDIVYDGVTFHVAQHNGEQTDQWYYTTLDIVNHEFGTAEYYLTGIGTFPKGPSQLPPDPFFLAEVPVNSALPSGPIPQDSSEVCVYEGLDDFLAAGDYVNQHGHIHNSGTMDTFLSQVYNLEPAQVRAVKYTIAGAPILTDVTYDGTQFAVTLDSTRDPGGYTEAGTNYYTALELVYVPETDITEYRLTEPVTGIGQAFPLNYMVLKYDLGDTTSP